eukprot:TRINITY_DN10272_c0_g2_i3.p2 TRINITY_DN10272_c0_g2~~TRINITY_DN10272_c0_g2_i3.p2  ORF type:complete len:295 (+),score=29.67 TRINITY_DN10272_c0_g2_i3:3178-4062(+)
MRFLLFVSLSICILPCLCNDPCLPMFPDHVFYNRIPKAGSSTLKYLAYIVSKESNSIKHISSRNYRDRGWFPEEQELNNARRIQNVFTSSATSKVIYDQHIRFIDFTKHSLPEPVYINMVRDPCERVTSSYYYARFGGNSRRAKIRALLGDQADWTINQCIEAGERCKSWNNIRDQMSMMTEFFCGHDNVCQSHTPAMLEKAKHNLKERFFLVGITEEFDASLRLFEHLLPEYFENARKHLHARGAKNINAVKPEALTHDNCRQMLAHGLDGELYAYAKELFHQRLQFCLDTQT